MLNFLFFVDTYYLNQHGGSFHLVSPLFHLVSESAWNLLQLYTGIVGVWIQIEIWEQNLAWGVDIHFPALFLMRVIELNFVICGLAWRKWIELTE